MSASLRIHQDNGLYYVVAISNGSEPLFAGAKDRGSFEAALAAALDAAKMRVHAYCWTQWDARFIVEVSDQPLGTLMHRVTTAYSRDFNARRERVGSVFGGAYRSAPLETDSAVLRLVRHLHRAPPGRGRSTTSKLFPWCSHQAYLGVGRPPWLTTGLILASLTSDTRTGLDGYRALMAAKISEQDRVDFGVGADASVFEKGDAAYLSSLRREVAESVKPASLEQVVEAVARRVGVEPDQIRSFSSVRRLSLARALVTWHASRNGICTAKAAAAHLNRDASTLYEGQERYRRLLPALFSESLEDLLNAEPHRGGAYVSGQSESQ